MNEISKSKVVGGGAKLMLGTLELDQSLSAHNGIRAERLLAVGHQLIEDALSGGTPEEILDKALSCAIQVFDGADCALRLEDGSGLVHTRMSPNRKNA